MLGTSLRSVESDGFARHSNCWMASEDHFDCQPADINIRRVLDVMGKLLRRGTTPPLHPDSERALLASAGLGHLVIPSPLPGDVSPELRLPHRIDATAFDVPLNDNRRIDALPVDSEEERLMIDWMADCDPKVARWLLPQASFDRLLQAGGQEAPGCRRCDFLWAPPGVDPLVIEVDGRQHDGQQLTDEDRDQRLEQIGMTTLRVGAAEVRAGRGPRLDAIEKELGLGPTQLELGIRAGSGPVGRLRIESQMRLVWGAIQVHRLALGLCEAVRRGFLGGNHWIVHVEDPTDAAVDLIGPYLDTLHALDRLWGSGTVVPEEVVFLTATSPVRFCRSAEGRYAVRDATNVQITTANARILLQCDHTPIQPLPASNGSPTVVIRSSGLGVLLSDPLDASAVRIAVRAEHRVAQDALQVLLRAVFAKEDFREGQFEAIFEVMQRRDCAVLLPTGAGKSLIYQLAGLCLPGRTLVVDPLVALAEDQIRGMRRNGIDRAVKIAGRPPSGGGGRHPLQAVADADAYFVLVMPERLQMRAFRNALAELTRTTVVSLAVVDEAHCVSEWGHDFRPAYLNLGRVLRETCARPPLLALTGTASRPVLRDVLQQLAIVETTEHSIVRPRTFDRPELHFRVARVRADEDAATLRGELKGLPKAFDAPQAGFFETDGERTCTGLIFVPTAGPRGFHNVPDTAEAVRGIIPSIGKFARTGMSEKDQSRNMNDFMNNRLVALVATKAFGMGIDKPNIRWVIHYTLPGSIEAYYQEVGRAGRDGQRAECILILTEFDANRNQRLLADGLDLESARRGQRVPFRQGDDVTTALYFHLNTFAGIDAEVDVLVDVACRLQPGPDRKTVTLPFGDDDVRRARERALYRLAVLGVVDDYLMGWGSQMFDVTLNGVAPSDILVKLVEFVERHEPGTGQERRDAVAEPANDLMAVVESCGRALVGCAYRNVEQSRRRSLREMRLMAHGANNNEEIHQWIEGYLTEGVLSNTMVDLAERSRFRYADWTPLWDGIQNDTDARELLFAAARLLGSYPNHPGLLASRATAEVRMPRGDQRKDGEAEFESNLMASLQAAGGRYAADTDDVDHLVRRILDEIVELRPTWAAGAIGAAHYAGTLPEWIKVWTHARTTEDWHLTPFPLADGIESARDLARRALNIYEEV